MTSRKKNSAWAIGDRRDVKKRPAGDALHLLGPYKIGLAAWVIQDGNYGEFKSNSQAQFAVEFQTNQLAPLEGYAQRKNCLRHITDDQYRAIGKIIHRKSDWIVADFGIHAYQSVNFDKELKVGDWVRGDIALEIDHFAYFERLNKETDAPPLIYSWHIDAIEILMAPYIDAGSGYMVHDKSKWGWKQVNNTNAWKDDDGAAEYCLTCTLTNATPKHKFTK